MLIAWSTFASRVPSTSKGCLRSKRKSNSFCGGLGKEEFRSPAGSRGDRLAVMRRVRGGCSILVTVAGVLSASTALAHVDLLEPEARAHGTAARGDTDIDVNSNLKSGPCGQVATGRTERVT